MSTRVRRPRVPAPRAAYGDDQARCPQCGSRVHAANAVPPLGCADDDFCGNDCLVDHVRGCRGCARNDWADER